MSNYFSGLMRGRQTLTYRREKLRRRVASKTSEAETGDSIASARANLRTQMKIVRVLQRHHMPALSDLLIADEETSESPVEDDTPEEDELYLPSSFSKGDRDEFGLVALAEKEMKMRRIYAESELEIVKLSIRMYIVDVGFKRKNVSGVDKGTRSQAILAKDRERRDKAMRRYNMHYDALVALGYDTADRHFQRIESSVAEQVKDMRSPEKIGSGRKSDAWFWREGVDVSNVRKKSDTELQQLNEEGAL